MANNFLQKYQTAGPRSNAYKFQQPTDKQLFPSGGGGGLLNLALQAALMYATGGTSGAAQGTGAAAGQAGAQAAAKAGQAAAGAAAKKAGTEVAKKGFGQVLKSGVKKAGETFLKNQGLNMAKNLLMPGMNPGMNPGMTPGMNQYMAPGFNFGQNLTPYLDIAQDMFKESGYNPTTSFAPKPTPMPYMPKGAMPNVLQDTINRPQQMPYIPHWDDDFPAWYDDGSQRNWY